MMSKIFGLFLLGTYCQVGYTSISNPECTASFSLAENLLVMQVKHSQAMELLEDKLDKNSQHLQKAIADVNDKVDNFALTACPNEWITFGPSCYYFTNAKMSFQDAKAYCKRNNAKLVEIETKEENVFVQDTLRKHRGDKFWIGITDEETEGQWVYAGDESPALILPWGARQPNNGRVSNCGAIWQSFNYMWVDEPCTNRFQPVCEKESDN